MPLVLTAEHFCLRYQNTFSSQQGLPDLPKAPPSGVRSEMEEKGLVISGTSPDGRLVETVELPGRAFHLGAQFHPEFKSRPNRAHPLFKGFIAAALQFRAAAQRSMMNV